MPAVIIILIHFFVVVLQVDVTQAHNIVKHVERS